MHNNEDIKLNGRLTVYGKKLLSLTLIFNSLLSIAYAVGLLAGYYGDGWKLYMPYLVDGALFWIVILVSILNMFPSVLVGQVKTGRLWFHHYVYGFFVLTIAIIFLIAFSPIPLYVIFTVNTTNMTVHVGRFFLLGGLTLVLDDLVDVSKSLRRAFCHLKQKVYKYRKIMHVVQWVVSFFSFYIFAAVFLCITQNFHMSTPANFILSATLLVTSLISFLAAKRKIWLQIACEKLINR
jgi:hypothetical protein